jgi:hypothetical protein
MSTTTHWERVSAGRYATEYLGHILQAVKNPDYPINDQRPYISVVDREPLKHASWSLSEAKSKAIRHVINGMSRPVKERNGIYVSRPQVEDEHPRTESDEGIDALFDDVPQLPEPQPEPEPEPIPQPEPGPEVEPVEPEPAPPKAAYPTLSITVTVTSADSLAALASIKETLSLMREVADVRCTLRMPEVEL